ncbi:putative acetyltransferase [Nocardioides dokdonensis FR1436]|uniref:Putative acetyltransferase n=1 Tax=Nocardioides dokdonensis FR1436 TaxID=1300347 RepID=A0A1A9GJ44_9ACTN|nr:GNAT family N-acetyltransferase [Nocardioides dokdonensis]ANH37643.1 putative acetyltransferase [Nocardioides dokdonensis FR1436]
MSTSACVPSLPDGLTTRPLRLADAPSVTEVIRAEELVDLGAAEMSVEEVREDWCRPSYDLSTSTRAVLDPAAGDRLVAYVDHTGDDVAYAGVHPAYQGRGIGTWLAAWVQQRAREAGATRIGSQVPQGSAADRFMQAQGYRLRWTAWDLELPAGTTMPAAPLAPGHTLRDAEPADHEPAWTLLEDCFLEWAERPRQPFDDFGARIWDREGYAPWQLRLVHDESGALVGATHVHLSGGGGYVAKIGVRRDRRGRGLAAAMLTDAFALARAHGARRCYLSTDSRTGALGLYEHVGMVVSSTWVHRAVDL